MSADFFGALARRAMAGPAVRPRLASRFEGDSGMVPDDSRERVDVPTPTASPTVPVLRAEHVPADRAVDRPVDAKPAWTRIEPLVQRDGSPRPMDIAREAAAPLPDPARARRRPAADAPPPALAQVVPLVPVPKPGAAPEPVVPRPPTVERVVQERVEQRQANTVRTLIESRVSERLTVEPARVASAPPAAPSAVQVQRQAEAAAAPRVEIHIGRIEVMPATSPPAARPQLDEAPPPKAQSLDVYLAQRRRP